MLFHTVNSFALFQRIGFPQGSFPSECIIEWSSKLPESDKTDLLNEIAKFPNRSEVLVELASRIGTAKLIEMYKDAREEGRILTLAELVNTLTLHNLKRAMKMLRRKQNATV